MTPSKEETEETSEERTIKTRTQRSKGRNEVKAIRKKRGKDGGGAEGRKTSRTGLVCDENSLNRPSDWRF